MQNFAYLGWLTRVELAERFTKPADREVPELGEN